ncbi:Phosphomannomutase/phosphoglucomutase [subsurface metagenome]
MGESLTPQLASKFAQAFGTYLGRGSVIVGQDSRQSGTMVKKAVLSGLLSVGCKPVEIGICPIPSIQVLTNQTKAIGAIAVTASHNPKEWNGLKFLDKGGLFLNYHQVEEFLDIYHQGEYSLVDVDKYKIPEFEKDPTDPHLKKLLSYFKVNLIREKKLKVALDCANGAGAVLAPEYLKALGCELVLLNCVPDGAFAHHPEPLPENIAELCRTVVEKSGDLSDPSRIPGFCTCPHPGYR